MTFQKVLFDKESAEKLLANAVGDQRPLDDKMVAEMVTDIQKGTFKGVDAIVCLETDGRLFYGQHILHAVIDSGMKVNLYVFTLDEYDTRIRGELNEGSKYKYNCPSLAEIKSKYTKSGGDNNYIKKLLDMEEKIGKEEKK